MSWTQLFRPEDARSVQIQEMVGELLRLGYAKPELDTEITDPERGRAIAEAKAFWPDGLNTGLANLWYWNRTLTKPTCPGSKSLISRASPRRIHCWASSTG